MKKWEITVFILMLSMELFGQSTDYSICLNSGLFRFSGESAERIERINYNLEKEEGYTNNPYGSLFGISYGFSVDINRLTKSNLRIGLGLGFENLRSRIEINSVWQHNDNLNESITAKGKSILSSKFINLFPSIGYQISVNQYNVNIDGGIDFGCCISATEKGYARSTTREYETKIDRKTIDFDVRPRIQVGFLKNNFGGFIGYSKGLINYKSGYDGGINKAFGDMVRIGLIYKIEK